MGVKWTPEQESAIIAPKDSSLDNQTLLVAAAAGSGKTAVLVERIITRLKDMDNPLSVQELMVVTFTKAVAQEMSARIGLALAKAMESTDNAALQARLERQLNLLPSAHISTLHSFCQWVIRSYFYKLDINPTARIGNEAEMALLQQEVLADLLTKSYEEGLYNIYELADFFSDDKSDAGLTAKIMSLYNYAMSLANPDGWLRKALEPYKEAMDINPSDTLWGQYMWSNHMAVIDRIRERLERMEQILLDPTGPHKWQNIYDNQLAALGMLSAAQTWDDMGEACKHVDTFIKDQFRMGSKEAQAYDPILLAEFKSLGGQNKDDLKAMQTAIFTVPEATLQDQFKAQYPIIEGLVELTIAFHQAYRDMKQEQGIMDFSDLEHLCLALLVEPGTEDDPQPSEVAKELQDTFKEIMVDEYQDTNGVQETIINLISRIDNRFYVGDVKQAIYSFRMADSSLFMEKYNTYGGNDAVERRIDLAKNFRSDANILAATNFLFYQIMTEEAAELNYTEAESLIPGRIVEDAPEDWIGGDVELQLLDVSKDTLGASESDEDEGDDPENNERELDFIIQKIKEIYAAKKQVQNPDGTFRQIEWRDFAILRRSLAGWGMRAVEAMRQAGIPAVVNERDGYFEAQEIQLLLALLSIIDNPEQDLPMAAVLHSGLVGLDANELGALRLSGEGSLWSLMPAYAEEAQDERLLAFIGHMDTVFPAGTAGARPFRLDRAADRATGPGVTDMKAGIVQNMFVARALKELGLMDVPMTLTFSPDEELGSPSTTPILGEQLNGAQAVICTEPGYPGGGVTLERKGSGHMFLEIMGISAHAGRCYQDGASAILELAHKILAFDAYVDLDHDTTVNTGLVNGGTRSLPMLPHASILRSGRLKQGGDWLKRSVLKPQRTISRARVHTSAAAYAFLRLSPLPAS